MDIRILKYSFFSIAEFGFNIMPHYRDYAGMMAEPFGRLRAGWVETALCSQAVRIMFIMLLAADSSGFGTLKTFLRTERFSVFK